MEISSATQIDALSCIKNEKFSSTALFSFICVMAVNGLLLNAASSRHLVSGIENVFAANLHESLCSIHVDSTVLDSVCLLDGVTVNGELTETFVAI